MRAEPVLASPWRGRGLLGWWAAGWLLAILLIILTSGLRRLSLGRPFFGGWTLTVSTAMLMVVGALLSPIVLLLCTRLRRAARSDRLVYGYIAIGFGYWLAWAAGVAVYAYFYGPPWYQEVTAMADVLIRVALSLGNVVVVTYVVLVMAFETVWYRAEVARRQAEADALEVEVQRARAAALQARVNPAFAIDTFATAATILETDVKLARRMLVNFGELLRVSLSADGVDRIDLASEIELARRLLQVRLAGRSPEVELTTVPDIPTGVVRVPPLFLQPLIIETAALIADASLADPTLHAALLRSSSGFALELVLAIDGASVAGDGAGALERRLEAAYPGRAISVAPVAGRLRITVPLEEAARMNPSRSD